MNYENALKELTSLVKDVWKKIDSGFYPEIDEELKLLAIQNTINAGHLKNGFWDLFFLIKDLLAMSGEDLSEDKKKLMDILKKLDDQETAHRELEKINKRSI